LAVEPLYSAGCHDARFPRAIAAVDGPSHDDQDLMISKYRKVTSACANGIRRIRSVGRNIRSDELSPKKSGVQ
jgi:hypothetical protein